MERLPFNPKDMAKKPDPVAARAPFTITQLAAQIGAVLSQGFPASVRVVGEVSGFRDRTHWYFDLKDEGAVVNCVMFASAARKSGFTPENGRQVLAQGRIEFYAPGGKVSLIIDRLEPVGAGALEAALKKLMEELRAKGYFSPERKRPLPAFPRRIAVVTSRTGAALQDVLDTMRRRCPAVGVVVADARVQGQGAAAEVAAAIDTLNAHAARLGIDAILVTRGGGSMEDLWAFNERAVADAIFRSELPVVAAIGHETDTTIAELVADERCATPTQAAVRLTPDRAALSRQLESLHRRLSLRAQACVRENAALLRAAEQRAPLAHPRRTLDAPRAELSNAAEALSAATAERLKDARVHTDRLMQRLEAASPARQHALRRERLAALSAALARLSVRFTDDAPLVRAQASLRAAVLRTLAAHTRAAEAASARLEAVSPLSVLARGYSVTFDAAGRAVRAAAGVSPGERLTTRLADGSIESTVTGAGDAPPLPPRPPRAPANRPGRKDPSQLGLF